MVFFICIQILKYYSVAKVEDQDQKPHYVRSDLGRILPTSLKNNVRFIFSLIKSTFMEFF